MNSIDVKENMKQLCQLSDWQTLVEMLVDGYKGMYVVLRIIRDSEQSVGTCEVARQMHVSTARVATALNTLENKGFVVRSCWENDARKVQLQLTEEGEQALAQREAQISQTVSQLLGKLTEEEAESFFCVLNKLLK